MLERSFEAGERHQNKRSFDSGFQRWRKRVGPSCAQDADSQQSAGTQATKPRSHEAAKAEPRQQTRSNQNIRSFGKLRMHLRQAQDAKPLHAKRSRDDLGQRGCASCAGFLELTQFSYWPCWQRSLSARCSTSSRSRAGSTDRKRLSAVGTRQSARATAKPIRSC